MSTNSSATLMTQGSIWKKIIAFAIPLFLGNLFQQFYNTADSLIVGNFLGSSALAAVSSSGNLIFLMVGFFNGLAVGAGVVVARYFGAKKFDLVQRAIHTIITLGFFCGIALTFIGVVAAPQILVLMGTPADVLPNSVTYFRIYFCGSLAFVMYNFLVGILQAVGDSRHPLMYLIFSLLPILFWIWFCLPAFISVWAPLCTGNSNFPVFKRTAVLSASAKRAGIPHLSVQTPHRHFNAETDYFQWSSGRFAKFHYFSGKCGSAVQH